MQHISKTKCFLKVTGLGPKNDIVHPVKKRKEAACYVVNWSN